MRLHHLELTAFGPFPGREEVDFDALTDAGLFLLTGATGAGKTSILDAVCFALYGTVPGARGVKALKSQHAEDTVAPEVVLDFSVRDRRFVVRRSPEWTRPKLRGTGLRTEKAAASLTEVRPDGDHFLTSRAAEVGLMIAEMVGMQAAQFQQVAMLPQGEFQRFLHASTQDRHAVLQHLFRTDRFARIEEWIHDHSRRLKDASGAGEQSARRLVHLIGARAECETPAEIAEPTESGLEVAAGDGRLLDWARGVLAEAEAALTKAQQGQQEAATTRATAMAALAEARRLEALHRRRAEGLRQLAALAQQAPEADADRRALDDAARASACRPVLELLAAARTEAARAVVEKDELLGRMSALAAPDLGSAAESCREVGADGLATVERTLAAQLSAWEALLPRLEARSHARRQQSAAQARLDEATTSHASLTQALDQLPAREVELEKRRAQLADRSGRQGLLRLQLTAAEARLAAARALPAARARKTELEDAARDARDRAADARERVQDLQARRLAGIAAELAGRLSDGEPCHVCGSPDHPAPATAAASTVSDALQVEADEAWSEAQETLVAVTERLADAAHELEMLEERADGRTEDAAHTDVQSLRDELGDAEAASDALVAIQDEVAGLGEERRRLTREAATLEDRRAAITEELLGHRATATAIEDDITRVLGDDVDPGHLPERLPRLRHLLTAVGEACDALDRTDHATSRQAELVATAERTVVQHGFGSVDAAQESMLDDDRRESLERRLSTRADQEAAARAVLADPDVAACADQEPPDVVAAEAVADRATTEAEAAAARLHLQQDRVAGLRSLVPKLEEALTEWQPVRDDFARTDAMARLVRGVGGDNHLQMRLSAYVLARRLDQVLDAANERLAHMRDQRYLLQRTDRARRKNSQAGLGLEVIDQWTGDVRDPSTLSGGETFVVSLALALGLADVVSAESGGTEIETLFVDEGFGTLDPDTLDDVMDRLDGLRAGGRTVGIVSHVSELRTRIPTQLHVRKTPTGSSIHARALVG